MGEKSNEMKLTPFLPPPLTSPQASLPPAASSSQPLASAPVYEGHNPPRFNIVSQKYCTKFAKTADTPIKECPKEGRIPYRNHLRPERERRKDIMGERGRGYRASERPAARSGHLLAIPSPSPLLSIRVCQDLLSSFSSSSSFSRGEASFRSWYFPSG